ncbi:Adenylyl-sulfate kinase [Andreprevotia sp. IGB-42]|uniref:AAA family ATPase n=1 Tax=Andreprevotia sp. IGB-42 TaxID=2497473 RepID=UPI00135863A1|nr:AAA family ATPase [Andreprevotia sp. IGB-42]KAF0812672.1 Adenylyl-sulfate kinase [Andreprevotia sp. IGB-42]
MKTDRPILYIFSGLPGSGKTTLAQAITQQLEAAYLRIDTIEQVLRDLCAINVQGEGYQMAYRIAADNLQQGMSVIADSCNPIALTRHAWAQVAQDAHAHYINIEVICTDPVEHRHRVETRAGTVPGLTLPTWQDVANREYHAWAGERIIIDTAGKSIADSVDALLYRLAHHVQTDHTLCRPTQV